MSEKYFGNTCQNDINFLNCELEDTISKGEKIRQECEDITRKERELKLRIEALKNGW